MQQDVFLFDGSVRDNIAYGRHDATDAEVEDAARRANAHEFIDRLPERLRHVHRRARREALRRAAAAAGDRPRDPRVPQILILDEATSNLDTESEQLIQASMATLLAGRTTFVIAHRLSTIRRADLILLMEDGRVIERGTHDELMTAAGSTTRWCCGRWNRRPRRARKCGSEKSGVSLRHNYSANISWQPAQHVRFR